MPKGSENVTTHKVEVFRPGNFVAMGGGSFSFSADDVQQIADSYDAESNPAPAVVGHPQHDDPAFGWAKGFEVNDKGVLVAELEKLQPEFVDAVKEGRYRKISMKFFPPEHPANPKRGVYYPRHIGFLGGAAPAVSGLAPVQFAEEGDAELIEIEFSVSSDLEQVATQASGMFRKMREWLIDKYSVEEADKVIPEYQVSWIEEAGRAKPETSADPVPGFSAEPQLTTEDEMSAEELAAREAALNVREAALAEGENTAFVDGLVEEGKLVPALADRVVSLMGSLAASGLDEVAFSVDGKEQKSAPLDLLKSILSEQPEVVPQGSTDLSDDPADSTRKVAFSAPDGFDVDPDGLELHRKALAYQAANPGTSYIDAAAAVEGGQ